MHSTELQRLKDVIFFLKKEKLLKNQQEIAEKTDYAYTTISEILNSKQPLTDKFIRVFSKMYNVNPNFILKSEGEMMLSNEINIANESETTYGNKMPGTYILSG